MFTITNEQRSLVADNHNLIYSFLQMYHLSVDEYYDVAAIGLCKASCTYCSEKSNFSTYAYKCMFTTVMLEIRKNKTAKSIPKESLVYYQAEVLEGETFLDSFSSNDNVENSAVTNVSFEKFFSTLNDRDKKILELLQKGCSQIEIGDRLGYSQSVISRIKSKLYKRLVNVLDFKC